MEIVWFLSPLGSTLGVANSSNLHGVPTRRYSCDIEHLRTCQLMVKIKILHLKVNHEQFHRMLDEYREAKRRELDLELKAKQ